MDVDLWSSRVYPSKYLSAVQAGLLHPDNHIILDDSDADDYARACFSCPFCYLHIEVRLLCVHLHEEHCFDFKNSRPKNPEKSAASDTVAKKLSKNESSPDPRLTSFICLIPLSGRKEENFQTTSSTATNNFKSTTASMLKENDEENAEKSRRADFIQQLISSTIFWY